MFNFKTTVVRNFDPRTDSALCDHVHPYVQGLVDADKCAYFASETYLADGNYTTHRYFDTADTANEYLAYITAYDNSQPSATIVSTLVEEL